MKENNRYLWIFFGFLKSVECDTDPAESLFSLGDAVIIRYAGHLTPGKLITIKSCGLCDVMLDNGIIKRNVFSADIQLLKKVSVF